jgi:hypothetical protein
MHSLSPLLEFKSVFAGLLQKACNREPDPGRNRAQGYFHRTRDQFILQYPWGKEDKFERHVSIMNANRTLFIIRDVFEPDTAIIP